MVLTFVFVTDRESIRKLLLEKETDEEGGGGNAETQELFQDLLKPKLTKNINKKETTTTIARGGAGAESTENKPTGASKTSCSNKSSRRTVSNENKNKQDAKMMRKMVQKKLTNLLQKQQTKY